MRKGKILLAGAGSESSELVEVEGMSTRKIGSIYFYGPKKSHVSLLALKVFILLSWLKIIKTQMTRKTIIKE